MELGEYHDDIVRFERDSNPGIRFGIRGETAQIGASAGCFSDYLDFCKRVRLCTGAV